MNTWEYGFELCSELGGDGFGFGITYDEDGDVLIHSLETPYHYFIHLGWVEDLEFCDFCNEDKKTRPIGTTEKINICEGCYREEATGILEVSIPEA